MSEHVPSISTMSAHALSISTSPATPRQRRLALWVVLVSAAAFALAAPYAQVQLARVDAFIPVYESALTINDLVTAVLLLGQFQFTGSRALVILAAAYLFTALMTVVHALTFPGLFAPAGLLGAGPQTTAWLYMFWHGGFPLLVALYALQNEDPQKRIREDDRFDVAVASGLLVLVAVCAFTLVATTGARILPAIMQGHRYTPAMIFVVATVWGLSLGALALLWRRKLRTVLDVWLMVVLCAWLFDVALAAVLNAGRFDLGFYAGRIYGFLASSFVLIVLLLESNAIYHRLVEAHERARHEQNLVLEKTRELTVVNRELDAFAYSVSHDLRAPLRAIDGYGRMLEEEHAGQLDNEGKRLLGIVRECTQQMGRLIDDLLALSRAGRQPLNTRSVELQPLVHALIEESRAGNGEREIRFVVGELGSVEADPVLVKQVLANLVGNAVKFTARSEPAIVEVGRSAATPGEPLVYYVKDNGAGFDMKYYNKLFGVFQRLHRADDYPGTGVGLAIVNRIVTRHGGTVWAESQQGEGATFYFTLGATPTGGPQASA